MPNFRIDYLQDIETVYRFMTDPEAIKKRSEALGDMKVRVQVDEAGGTKTITNTREIESDLPAFAKKLFKSTNTIVERREWRDQGDTKTCRSHIDVVGTPGKIDQNITLSRNGSGCTYEVDFEVSAKVPLIGKKLEQFMANSTLDGIRDEHAYNQKELGAQT